MLGGADALSLVQTRNEDHMVIPLSLLHASDLRTEIRALIARIQREAELGESSDGLHCAVMQMLVEAASLPSPSAQEQEGLFRAIALADEGKTVLALAEADEALRLRIQGDVCR